MTLFIATSKHPLQVHRSGGLLIIGFEDGVVRLLQLYSTETPHQLTWPNTSGDVKLRLQQAFKPHKAAVTALSCERDILATGVRSVFIDKMFSFAVVVVVAVFIS